MADPDVIIVGAGVAGLAAAQKLRAKGRHVELLEAGPRIGGRAYTSQLYGQPFDHGAQWLHAAHRNPLIPLAQASGEATHPEDHPGETREGRLHVTEAHGHPADMAAYNEAERAWQATVKARLAGPDCSLAEAAAPLATNAWTPTIEAWEGAIIAAADADALSLADWHANALEGENYVAPGGLGALLHRLLTTQAPLNTTARLNTTAPLNATARLNTKVTGITAEPGGVRVQTSAGPLRAKAAIVTVSTGVLRAGHITFVPALPPETLAALDGLPMGLLSKIVLRAASPNRLGLRPGTNAFRRLRDRGAPFLSTLFWAGGTDLAVGFVGGRAAWSLAHHPAEAGAFMRAELASTLGSHAQAAFTDDTLTTDWGTNPFFLGAYAYARPGHATARATLAVPLWDGRLVFAGEACATDGLAGTVAGAYESGRQQAVLF